MNSKKNVSLLFGLLMALALFFVACQAGGETETEKTATSVSPAVSSDVPATVETPDAPASAIDPLTAALSELQGFVEMKQSSQPEFLEASTGLILDLNGQVRTSDTGKARLDLSSGTIVRVSPSSLFTLIANEEVDDGLATKVKLELGRIFVILSGGSLEVDTPSGVASVRGSYLKVEYNPENETLELTCLEGNCSVVTPGGETINFTDNQKIVIRKDPETGQWIVDEGPMDSDDFNEWLENNPEAKELVEAALATLEGSSSGDSTTKPACFSLLQPGNGSDFPKYARVDFSWETQPGAAKYVLTFSYPTGNVVLFQTSETNMTRYIESMPLGGNYSWSVTAYDGTGTEICESESNTFSKVESPQPTPTKVKEEEVEEIPVCDPCDTNSSCYDPENLSCYPQEVTCDPCDPSGSCYDRNVCGPR